MLPCRQWCQIRKHMSLSRDWTNSRICCLWLVGQNFDLWHIKENWAFCNVKLVIERITSPMCIFFCFFVTKMSKMAVPVMAPGPHLFHQHCEIRSCLFVPECFYCLIQDPDVSSKLLEQHKIKTYSSISLWVYVSIICWWIAPDQHVTILIITQFLLSDFMLGRGDLLSPHLYARGIYLIDAITASLTVSECFSVQPPCPSVSVKSCRLSVF